MVCGKMETRGAVKNTETLEGNVKCMTCAAIAYAISSRRNTKWYHRLYRTNPATQAEPIERCYTLLFIIATKHDVVRHHRHSSYNDIHMYLLTSNSHRVGIRPGIVGGFLHNNNIIVIEVLIILLCR